ncbi:DASH complex subunit Dad4 [Kockovaella imperatae]|uniref:DASH complex subunit DAD4 n=1 Tax=Kockovaella imperatae TaxID=4999 RepID=A0A1Y1UD75_9TREE|nr:DASH complex subunit Dad4 [Kockovaella imperatae]ORX35980.1 DASH complex subunit Dad4 [Kockovaella imperatae]
MENPHEAEQAVLLERIVNNVDKANEAVLELNHCIKEYLASSDQITMASDLSATYSRNIKYNLESQGKMPKPL